MKIAFSGINGCRGFKRLDRVPSRRARGRRNFVPAISDPENLLVPPIVVFEVARQMLVKRGANATQTAIAYLSAGQTEPLNIQMAGEVALFAVKHRLPMADAIIFATARRFGAEIWTQVADFQGLPGKRYFTKVS